MSNQSFNFRQFTICQDRCAMKVGTDGVLLGAWAHGGHNILDIGTGTGLITLMLAQRFGKARLTAVEIDHEAAIQASENVNASPFAVRVTIVETPIQSFSAQEKFDAIVSNPPFFTDSLKNPDSQRATARHADTLPYRELFAAVSDFLAEDGEFSAVIPFDCLSQFTAEAYLAGLALSRRCAIRTTPRKQPKRYLVAFKHAAKASTTATDEQCIMNADGTRSEWYDMLTKDFYIK